MDEEGRVTRLDKYINDLYMEPGLFWKENTKMASRIELIESFKDTRSRVKENPELAQLTLQMQAGTMLYLKEYKAMNPAVKSTIPDVTVREDTTFHAASLYAGKTDKVAVLNFANAYTPGGSVREGIMAQEECLCRSSNLYAALTMSYLMKNYYKWNAKYTGEMGTDAVIYSPGVTVFKTDDEKPEDLNDWYQVDVITCAAPYYNPGRKRPVSYDKLRDVFFGRIRNILEVAAANDVDILVLGAFGCGAFNNPPDLVAETFRQLLIDMGYGKYFRRVIFAIKGREGDNPNMTAFQNVFSEKE